MMSPLNFPWIGPNPPKVAVRVFLFALILSLPLLVLAFVVHRPLLVLLPFAAAACVSLPIWAANLWARSMVSRLDERLKIGKGEYALRSQCLIVRGIMKMPGIVAVHGQMLCLSPIFGPTTEIPLEQVGLASEVKWFNGRLLFGQARGFWLVVGQNKRLGFAVEDADAWRAILTHRPETSCS